VFERAKTVNALDRSATYTANTSDNKRKNILTVLITGKALRFGASEQRTSRKFHCSLEFKVRGFLYADVNRWPIERRIVR
jgi:hypothetical protein